MLYFIWHFKSGPKKSSSNESNKAGTSATKQPKKKEYTKQDLAAIKIQTCARGFLARRKLEKIKKEKEEYEETMERLEKEV